MSVFENNFAFTVEPVTLYDPTPGREGLPARGDHRHIIDSGAVDLFTRNTDKNLIQNPEFIICQRALPITGFNVYAFDRWCLYGHGGAACRADASTDVPPENVQRSVLYTVTTANAAPAATHYLQLSQRIEGYFAAQTLWGTSRGKTCTLSFWAKSSVTGTYCVSIRNGNATRSFVSEYQLEAGVWKRVVITIPPETSGSWLTLNDLGITLDFNLQSGTTYTTPNVNTWQNSNFIASSNQVNFAASINATFQLTAVQFEVSDIATPWYPKNIITDLLSCKRYLQVYNEPPLRGVISSATVATRCGMILPVRMRDNPILTLTGASYVWDGGAGGLITAVAASYVTHVSVEHDLIMAGGGFTAFRPAIVYNNSGTSTWIYSAEL